MQQQVAVCSTAVRLVSHPSSGATYPDIVLVIDDALCRRNQALHAVNISTAFSGAFACVTFSRRAARRGRVLNLFTVPMQNMIIVCRSDVSCCEHAGCPLCTTVFLMMNCWFFSC